MTDEERRALQWVLLPDPPPEPPGPVYRSLFINQPSAWARWRQRGTTVEELEAFDLSLSPQAEIAARLHGTPPDVAARVRALDQLVDQRARDLSRTWSRPLERNETYHALWTSALRVVIEVSGVERNAASVDPRVLIDEVYPAVARVQWERRHRLLWGTPLPPALAAEVNR